MKPRAGDSARAERRTALRCSVLLSLLAVWSSAWATCTPSAGFPPPVAPDSRYTVSEPDPVNHPGDRVVRDTVTGLVWKQCWEGLSGPACATGDTITPTWADALGAANASDHAGFTDWRLPTLTEVISLLEASCAPAINSQRFPGFSQSATLTSVSFASAPNSVWAITVFDGTTLQITKDAQEGTVILVRGGSGFAGFASERDYTPAAFSFAAQNGVPVSTPVASAAVAITGLTTVTGIRIAGTAGSSYSINGGPFTSNPGSLGNGDTVTVRHTSAASAGVTVSSVVTIGGVTAQFASTTGDASLIFRDGFE